MHIICARGTWACECQLHHSDRAHHQLRCGGRRALPTRTRGWRWRQIKFSKYCIICRLCWGVRVVYSIIRVYTNYYTTVCQYFSKIVCLSNQVWAHSIMRNVNRHIQIERQFIVNFTLSRQAHGITHELHVELHDVNKQPVNGANAYTAGDRAYVVHVVRHTLAMHISQPKRIASSDEHEAAAPSSPCWSESNSDSIM